MIMACWEKSWQWSSDGCSGIYMMFGWLYITVWGQDLYFYLIGRNFLFDQKHSKNTL